MTDKQPSTFDRLKKAVIADPNQYTGHSSIETRPDGTRSDTPSPSAATYTPTVEEPRKSPKGTREAYRSGEKTVIEIRCVHELWWWLSPAIATTLGVIGLFVVTPIMLLSMGLVGFLIPLASIIGPIWVVLTRRFWLPIEISEGTIKVGGKYYAREHSSGFRIGYKVEGQDAGLKNHFMDKSFGMTGLRLSYGEWGEDLPYLINSYHSAEMVIWMNGIVAGVGKTEAEPGEAGPPVLF